MKQIQNVNIVWFCVHMVSKQFVNGGFYEEKVIDSNIANSSL